MQPSFFLQQLRNESLELGLSGQQARAEAELAKLGWPHLYERFKVNRESPELVRTLMGHSDSVRCVALSADGRLAVSASGRYDGLGELKVWDVVTGRELRTLGMHPDGVEVNGVALSADGRVAVSVSWNIKVWDVATGRELHALSPGWHVVALSADGCLVISATYHDDALIVWDVATGRELHRLKGHSAMVKGVALSGNGRLAISASHDKTLKVWDIATGHELRTLKGHSGEVK